MVLVRGERRLVVAPASEVWLVVGAWGGVTCGVVWC